jgi:hypothetical protein
VVPAPAARPLVYLGIRRGWWVVLCVLLLAAVDAVPTVGPYLSLAVLLWMVSGLAHAQPAPEPVARPVRAAEPIRAPRTEHGAALPSA